MECDVVRRTVGIRWNASLRRTTLRTEQPRLRSNHAFSPISTYFISAIVFSVLSPYLFLIGKQSDLSQWVKFHPNGDERRVLFVRDCLVHAARRRRIIIRSGRTGEGKEGTTRARLR